MNDATLKKYFWDVDIDSLDVVTHKQFVLERILELGDENAVAWMRRSFSKADMLAALRTSRRISNKSKNFWNFIFGT